MESTLTKYRSRLSWYFVVPAVVVLAGVVVPLVYLFVRAFDAQPAELADILWRMRNVHLLINTLGLAAGVLVATSLIAFPLAWLTTRSDLRGRRVITWLGVLPLAVPGYVMAYVLLATTGSYGTLSHLFGIEVSRITGFWGSLVALTLYTFPYLFLNLRASMLGLDASLEESARSLGYSGRQTFFRVILPQLRPGFYAGGLLVALHVIGDFGVVSLMRFETFSYALYLQYASAFDRVYAAWLALMLLGLTGGLLLLEARFLRGLRFDRTGTGMARRGVPVALGRWKALAYGLIAALMLLAVVLPATTVGYWMLQAAEGQDWARMGRALWASVSASAPAALLCGLLALPISYLSVRQPSTLSRSLERVSYLGYATPPLAFALAIVFFSLQAVPFLYQTLLLLVLAYTLHFLAEAIGPVRSALYQAPPRLEEAARSLGRTPLQAFREATFPLLRKGLLVSIAFVFLSAIKELPITFLLSPIGFETLALGVWSSTNEALFGTAAPYALVLILFSAAFVGLLLMQERTH